jgi:hypothetical protein
MKRMPPLSEGQRGESSPSPLISGHAISTGKWFDLVVFARQNVQVAGP